MNDDLDGIPPFKCLYCGWCHLYSDEAAELNQIAKALKL